MELVESFDLNRYAELLTDENLARPVYFKIIADARTGEIRIYNPVDGNLSYYVLNMDKGVLPIKGDWIVLRTNGMRMSFASSGFEE
jgi:predicted small secreted protein